MLAKRVIPCLDVDGGRVVKGVKFVDIRDAGDVADCAGAYDRAGADELVFLDITASAKARAIRQDWVRRAAESLTVPFTVGGGLTSIEEMQEVLNLGADKISINTAAVKRPELIREAAAAFGSQCVVVAIDARWISDFGLRISDLKSTIRNPQSAIPSWEVYIHGGRTGTGKDAVAWAVEAERLGAGEILLTSMDRDGTKEGYDLDLLRAVTS
ncbi:imidazole glycerol phosphate synthase subunit HisF, partial [bacterium]|nr:imidazole glycerol phosphate synthase subunit HisF [bacterium]